MKLYWDNSSAAWGSWTLYGDTYSEVPGRRAKYIMGFVVRKQVGRVRLFYAQAYTEEGLSDPTPFKKLSEAKGWVVAVVTLETEDG